MKLNGYGNGRKKRDNKPFVEGKRTCPICRQTSKWDCNFTEDGSLVYCKNVKNTSGETDALGKYKYTFEANNRIKESISKQTINEVINKSVKADADRLDKAYSALLENLKLKPSHLKNLIERGLDTEQVYLNMYASVPTYKRTEIVHNLSKSLNFEGVPGFYLSNKIWQLNMNYSGFYIPYRDEKGRIVGLQIRRDEKVKDKYIWVSSGDKEKGISSGSPLHFVNVEEVKTSKIICLTEGALKADVIGFISGVGLCASAGLSLANAEKLDSIFEVFPDLEKVVVAYDMDWQTNESVRTAFIRLLDALKERNVKVEVATWDMSLGKGLDDVLVNENYTNDSVKFILADEFRVRLSSIVIEETEVVKDRESINNIMNDEVTDNPDFRQTQELEFEQVNFDFEQESERTFEIKDNPFVYSYGEFSELEVIDFEKVIFGLGRGNVGLMVASTNLGKTTLALNLSLSVTGRREFNPLLNNSHQAQRVLYIDGEATKAELQADIAKMLEVFTFEQVASVRDNLFLICDEELDDEPLDLVNSEHFELVKRKALACKPDLIVVDTLSALMDLEDENDNAKVKTEAIKPLKKLAKLTNSGVLLLHHTGKFSEGISNANKAYNGRGASAFGALSRTVITLEKVKANPDKVILSVPKVKGDNFDNTILELDRKSRWFNVVGEIAKPKAVSNSEQVVEFVIKAQRLVKRSEINLAFNGEDGKPHIAVSTITKHLNDAVADGRLDNSRYGYYSAPKNIEAELPIAV